MSFKKLIAGGHVSRDPITCGGFSRPQGADILRMYVVVGLRVSDDSDYLHTQR